MDAKQLTDAELLEHLAMIAPALRLARVDDLRHVADRAADLALEAGARLEARARLAVAGPVGGTIRDIRIDERRKLTARLEVQL